MLFSHCSVVSEKDLVKTYASSCWKTFKGLSAFSWNTWLEEVNTNHQVMGSWCEDVVNTELKTGSVSHPLTGGGHYISWSSKNTTTCWFADSSLILEVWNWCITFSLWWNYSRLYTIFETKNEPASSFIILDEDSFDPDFITILAAEFEPLVQD